MSDEAPFLPSEWLDAARQIGANLGLDRRLEDLSPEHWNYVLVSVEAHMRMLDVDLPDGWRETLTRQAGRDA